MKKVAVIGLGGYGRNALRGLDGLQEVCSTLMIDCINNLHKEEVGAIDIEFDGALSEKDICKIKEFLSSEEIVVIFAGLGKSNGEVIPSLLGTIEECGVFPINVFALPFSGEGKEKMQKAQEVLMEAEKKRGMHIVMPNDLLRESGKNYPQMGLRELFSLQYRPICDLIDLLSKAHQEITLQEILGIYDVLQECNVKVIEKIKVVF